MSIDDRLNPEFGSVIKIDKEAIYKTGLASKILGLSRGTVIRFFNKKMIKGYLVPLSKHRRFPYQSLISFAREYGMLEQVADYFGCSAQDL